jgi:hypothetical protein
MKNNKNNKKVSKFYKNYENTKDSKPGNICEGYPRTRHKGWGFLRVDIFIP